MQRRPPRFLSDNDEPVVIGEITFDGKQVQAPVNSRRAADLKDYPTLSQRLQSDGYVAIPAFFSLDEIEEANSRIKKAIGDDYSGGDINLSTGEGSTKDMENRFRELGKDESLKGLLKHQKLQRLLKGILREGGDVEVLLEEEDDIPLDLAWLRVKGKEEKTNIHVDYHHYAPECEEDDMLRDDLYKQYNVWLRLSQEMRSSYLAVSPGSHKLKLSERKGAYPEEFQALIDRKEAKWHLMDGVFGYPGTLVLMNMRLVHASTANKERDLRISLDTRFRLRVKDERDIVYGTPPPPHWGDCKKWTRKCHKDHPQIARSSKLLLLANNHLKRSGRPFLIPDLIDLILSKLCYMCTPRWLCEPIPMAPKRLRRQATICVRVPRERQEAALNRLNARIDEFELKK